MGIWIGNIGLTDGTYICAYKNPAAHTALTEFIGCGADISVIENLHVYKTCIIPPYRKPAVYSCAFY